MFQLGIGNQIIQEELKTLTTDHVRGQIQRLHSTIIDNILDSMHAIVADRVICQVKFFELKVNESDLLTCLPCGSTEHLKAQ